MKHARELLAIVVLTCASGCMTFEVEGGGSLTPESRSDSETVHGSLYGFRWSDYTVDKCEADAGLYRVEYHTNAGFLLVSVLSLGLYVPQTVEWWCNAPQDEHGGGEEEVWDPDAEEVWDPDAEEEDSGGGER